MQKTVLVSIARGLACLAALSVTGRGQQPGGFGGAQSYGVSSSYSPDSSHILIGDCEQRRVWTLGAEYTRLLYHGPLFRLDYEASVMPLYEETDPVVTGTTFTLAGQQISNPQPAQRVVVVPRGPVGTVTGVPGGPIPVYAVLGRVDTYSGALSPLGARISALPGWRVQPSMALDLGFVASHRDIPIDQSDQFNYMFSFGPGVQFFPNRNTSWRVEYIYRHTSNAGQGFQNPGVDQGVIRVTLSHHR